jgi:hypothetical protein
MKSRHHNGLTAEEKSVFKKTFAFLAKELPNGIIRGNRSITPINLFEAVAVGVGLCVRSRKIPRGNVLYNAMNSNELKQFTTGATNSRKRVADRIEFIRAAVK